VTLVQRWEWRQATVVETARGFDPRGIEVGVPYRWIVTVAAAGGRWRGAALPLRPGAPAARCAGPGG